MDSALQQAASYSRAQRDRRGAHQKPGRTGNDDMREEILRRFLFQCMTTLNGIDMVVWQNLSGSESDGDVARTARNRALEIIYKKVGMYFSLPAQYTFILVLIRLAMYVDAQIKALEDRLPYPLEEGLPDSRIPKTRNDYDFTIKSVWLNIRRHYKMFYPEGYERNLVRWKNLYESIYALIFLLGKPFGIQSGAFDDAESVGSASYRSGSDAESFSGDESGDSQDDDGAGERERDDSELDAASDSGSDLTYESE